MEQKSKRDSNLSLSDSFLDDEVFSQESTLSQDEFENISTPILHSYLQDLKNYDSFNEFLRRNDNFLALDYLRFWKEVESLQTETNKDRLWTQISTLYELYLGEGAVSGLQAISPEAVKKVEIALMEGNVHNHILDECQRSAVEALKKHLPSFAFFSEQDRNSPSPKDSPASNPTIGNVDWNSTSPGIKRSNSLRVNASQNSTQKRSFSTFALRKLKKKKDRADDWEGINFKSFGKPLNKVIKTKYGVPLVVERCLEYLEQNLTDHKQFSYIPMNFFKSSGNKELFSEWKNTFEKGEKLVFPKVDSSIVAAFLKMYLEELPEPIFTWEVCRSLQFNYKENQPYILDGELLRSEMTDDSKHLTIRLIRFFQKIMNTCKLSSNIQNALNIEELASTFGPYFVRTTKAIPEKSRLAKNLLIMFIDDPETIHLFGIDPPVCEEKESILLSFSNVMINDKSEIGTLWLTDKRFIWRSGINSSKNKAEVPISYDEISHFEKVINKSKELCALSLQLRTNLEFFIIFLEDGEEMCTLTEIFMSGKGNSLSLTLRECGFARLPVELEQMTSLRKLICIGNNLQNFPTLVTSMTNLRKLYLDANSLSNVSMDVFQQLSKCLNKLYVFSLSYNGLEEVIGIGLLQKLRTLNLAHNKLKTFPVGLEKLCFLELLDLSHNKITGAMPQLETTKLISLNLEGNIINNIEGFNALPNLKYLNLNFNQIKELPDSLFTTSLQELFLEHNQLTFIPLTIARCTGLKKLHLNDNQLVSLPPSIGILPLQSFKITGNKLKISEEIQSKGNVAILSHYKALTEGLIYYFHSIAFCLGETKTGKTSFLKQLLKDKPKQQPNETDRRLNIYNWTFSRVHEGKKIEAFINFWDFSLNSNLLKKCSQLFYSERGIYIIFWNLVEGEKKAKLFFWLQNLPKKALVFIVGTNLDDEKVSKKTINDLTNSMQQKYQSNNNTGEGVSKFKHDFKDLVFKYMLSLEQVPRSFILLESEMLSCLKPPVASVSDVNKLAQMCNIKTESEMVKALLFFHKQGNIVYFQTDPRLSSLVILDVSWLLKTITEIFGFEHSYGQRGIISSKNLQDLWKLYSVSVYEGLIAILENFQFIYDFGTLDHRHKGFYFLPFLLSLEIPSTITTKWMDFPTSDEIQFGRIFKYSYIPYNLFEQFLIRLNYLVPPDHLIYWQHGVLIEKLKGKSILIFENTQEQFIQVYVRIPQFMGRLHGTFSVPKEAFQKHSEIISLILQIYDTISCLGILLGSIPDILLPCPHCIQARLTQPYLFTINQCTRCVAGNGTSAHLQCKQDSKRPQMISVKQICPDIALVFFQGNTIPYSAITIQEDIGMGSASIVRKGIWNNQTIAVKEFRLSEQVDQSSLSALYSEFVREVWQLNRLKHENIIQLYALCEFPLSIVTELFPKGNLYFYLHENSSQEMNWALKLKIALNIASGMNYLHSQKPILVHMDLKSPNILLESTDLNAPIIAKIADFGLSAALPTVAGRLVTNPVWLAPEIIRNKEYTHKVDVYSFGVILYEIAVRQKFFGELRFMSQLEDKILAGKRPTIPETCPKLISGLIEECWDNNPDHRPGFKQIFERLSKIEISEDMNTILEPSIFASTQRQSNEYWLYNMADAITFEDKAYVFLNDNCDKSIIGVYSFVTSEWEEIQCGGNIPSVYMGSGGTALWKDKILLFGGLNPTTGEYSNQLYQLNLKLFLWKLVPCTGNLPPKMKPNKIFVSNDELFVFGGYFNDISIVSIFKLSLKFKQWSEL